MRPVVPHSAPSSKAQRWRPPDTESQPSSVASSSTFSSSWDFSRPRPRSTHLETGQLALDRLSVSACPSCSSSLAASPPRQVMPTPTLAPPPPRSPVPRSPLPSSGCKTRAPASRPSWMVTPAPPSWNRRESWLSSGQSISSQPTAPRAAALEREPLVAIPVSRVTSAGKAPLKLGEHYDEIFSGRLHHLEALAAATLQRAIRSRFRRRRTAEARAVQTVAARQLQRAARAWLLRQRRRSGVLDFRLHVFTAALQRSMRYAGRRRGISSAGRERAVEREPNMERAVEREPRPAEREPGSALQKRLAVTPRGTRTSPMTPGRVTFALSPGRSATSPTVAGCAAARQSPLAGAAGDGPVACAASPGRPLLAQHQESLLAKLCCAVRRWQSPETTRALGRWRLATAATRDAHALRDLAAAHARTAALAAALGGLRRRPLLVAWRARVTAALVHVARCWVLARWRHARIDSRDSRRRLASAHARALERCAAQRRPLLYRWVRRTIVGLKQCRHRRFASLFARRSAERLALPRWRRATAFATLLRSRGRRSAAFWRTRTLPAALARWHAWCDDEGVQGRRRRVAAAWLVGVAAHSHVSCAQATRQWAAAASHLAVAHSSTVARARACRMWRLRARMRHWRRIASGLASATAVNSVGRLYHQAAATARVLAVVRAAAASCKAAARIARRSRQLFWRTVFGRVCEALQHASKERGRLVLPAVARSRRLALMNGLGTLASYRLWHMRALALAATAARARRRSRTRRVFAALRRGRGRSSRHAVRSCMAAAAQRCARSLVVRWRRRAACAVAGWHAAQAADARACASAVAGWKQIHDRWVLEARRAVRAVAQGRWHRLRAALASWRVRLATPPHAASTIGVCSLRSAAAAARAARTPWERAAAQRAVPRRPVSRRPAPRQPAAVVEPMTTRPVPGFPARGMLRATEARASATITSTSTATSSQPPLPSSSHRATFTLKATSSQPPLPLPIAAIPWRGHDGSALISRHAHRAGDGSRLNPTLRIMALRCWKRWQRCPSALIKAIEVELCTRLRRTALRHARRRWRQATADALRCATVWVDAQQHARRCSVRRWCGRAASLRASRASLAHSAPAAHLASTLHRWRSRASLRSQFDATSEAACACVSRIRRSRALCEWRSSSLVQATLLQLRHRGGRWAFEARGRPAMRAWRVLTRVQAVISSTRRRGILELEVRRRSRSLCRGFAAWLVRAWRRPRAVRAAIATHSARWDLRRHALAQWCSTCVWRHCMHSLDAIGRAAARCMAAGRALRIWHRTAARWRGQATGRAMLQAQLEGLWSSHRSALGIAAQLDWYGCLEPSTSTGAPVVRGLSLCSDG